MPRNRFTRNSPTAVKPADKAVFVTRRGVQVTLSRFSPLSPSLLEGSVTADWQAAGKSLPEKPTYTIQAAGGDVETHEHDEVTIKGNAEATAAWEAWQQATAEFNRDVFELQLRSFVIENMEFAIDPRWVAKAKAKRLRVPTDEYEAKVFWAEAEVISGMDEYFEMVAQSAELAGVTGPQMEVVRKSFRRALEELRGQADRRTAQLAA